jgi:hypothetical protein
MAQLTLCEGMPPDPLGGHDRGARPGKAVEHNVAPPRAVFNGAKIPDAGLVRSELGRSRPILMARLPHPAVLTQIATLETTCDCYRHMFDGES